MTQELEKRTVRESTPSAPAYAETMEALRQAERALPDFTSSYDGEISRLYNRIVNRRAFRYDPEGDPLYGSYRDRYVREGRLAMRDTMGQAAALTGGYGSSYGQAVGQQQFDAYLQKLGAVMPELYAAAYDRYRAEGEELENRLGTAVRLAGEEYGRYRDRTGRAAELEQKGYDRRQNSYQSLVSVISKSGYEPSDSELKQAGMSRALAEALRNEYLRANNLLPSSGASGGGGWGGWGGGSGKSGTDKGSGSKEAIKLEANRRGGSGSGKHRRK